MNPEPPKLWVTIARLHRAWGRRGELTATLLTGKPERFQQLRVFLFRDEEPLGQDPIRVESVREHGRAWVFKFRGVDTISQAEALERADIRIPAAERMPAEEGEHYVSDLLGCEVCDGKTGELLGSVTGWQDSGGTGLLEVGNGDEPLLIPFARSICVEINTAARRIVVELPAGLKDLNRS